MQAALTNDNDVSLSSSRDSNKVSGADNDNNNDEDKNDNNTMDNNNNNSGGRGRGSSNSSSGSSGGESNESKNSESKEGLSNQNGRHTRILTTKTGNLRFFGESSALSLLSECRALFRDVAGSSMFTDDPDQGFISDESVDYRYLPTPVQLPKKTDAFILIDLFKTNINDAFYVINMKYFNKHVFERIYADPINASTKKMCLLYMVFALGRLFSQCSPHISLNLPDLDIFFNLAEALFRSNIFDGRLWICEINLLQYFYFQSCCNRSNAWIQLGTAIRVAQALGLHRRCINESIADAEIRNHRRRLWRSLYVCDCVSSVNLGRPLMINDYDYDDYNFTIEDAHLDEVEKIRIIAQKATSDSAMINVRIVENIFRDGLINIKRAHALALELKKWSVRLPKELQLSAALESQMESGTDPNNYLYVFVHIGQLYGIMALTRPFLVYVVTRKLKPETKQQVKDEQSLMNFCKACIKASFLVIKLLKFFATHNPHRKEVFTIQSSCFFASIILGFTLLEQKLSLKPDAHYMGVLQDALIDAYNILFNYSYFNVTCKRWARNLKNMINALNSLDECTSEQGYTDGGYNLGGSGDGGSGADAGADADAGNFKDSAVPMTPAGETFNHEMISWGMDNKALEEILNFQQFFVPTVSPGFDHLLSQGINTGYRNNLSRLGGAGASGSGGASGSINSSISGTARHGSQLSDFLDAFRYDTSNHVVFGEQEGKII